MALQRSGGHGSHRSTTSVRRRIQEIVLRMADGWRTEQGEPHFWEVFASLAVLIVGFLAGYLTTPYRIVCAIAISISLAATVWRFRVQLHRRKRRAIKAFERLWTMLTGAVALIIVCAVVFFPWRHQGQPPAPRTSPGPGPGAEKAPVISYQEFPQASGEDIDVRIADHGFVRQTFAARSPTIASIVFIASRRHTPTAGFSEEHIGQVRMELAESDASGAVRHKVPIASYDADAPPNAAGFLVQAGPNHQNTLVRLRPVSVHVGRRYAFTVTNMAGDYIAFSVRPKGVSGYPLLWYGYERDPSRLQKRTDHALTAGVCDIIEGCSA
jgi:hypothetical protein